MYYNHTILYFIVIIITFIKILIKDKNCKIHSIIKNKKLKRKFDNFLK